MGQLSLESIVLSNLAQLDSVGGAVLHGLKSSSTGYNGFGEVYFSWIMPSAVKAWKRHKKMTMNLCVPVGLVRFVFYDETTHKFRRESIGEVRYSRLTVPPNIWFGFQCLAPTKSLVCNIADMEHDQNEVEKADLNKIIFDWKRT